MADRRARIAIPRFVTPTQDCRPTGDRLRLVRRFWGRLRPGGVRPRPC